MLPYYMTPETRQAVIEESNRLIATRAAMNTTRARGHDLERPSGDEASASADAIDTEPSSVDSVFARLVADLQSAAQAGSASDASVTTEAS